MKEFNKNKFRNVKLGKFWTLKNPGEYISMIDENKNIYEVKASDFIEYMINNKISIINNQIEHECAIDNENKICSKKEYLEWKKEDSENKNNSIDYNDLKIGHIYQFETKTDYFVYLGKKCSINWKFNKKTKKIEISKPREEYLGYVIYKHNKFEIDLFIDKNKIVLKKQIVIKEIGELKDLKQVEDLNIHLKETINCLYFENEKPNKNYTVEFKEYTREELLEFAKYKINFLNIFHKSGNYFILNNYGIYEESTDLYSRQVSCSKQNEIIFNSNLEAYQDNKDSYSYNTKLKGLTDSLSNEHYRLCPANYYKLNLIFN